MDLRDQSSTPQEVEKDLTPAVEPTPAQDATEDVVTPAAAPEPELPAAEPEPEVAPEPELPAAEEELALPAPEPQEAEAPKDAPEETPAAAPSLPQSKEEAIEALGQLAGKEAADISNDEIARLKHAFYNLHNAQIAEAKKAHIEAGGTEEDFTPAPDEAEEKFKELLATIKEKKAEARNQLEAEREKNLERKKAIVDTINSMSDDTDNVNRHYQRVKELQAEFKTIGEVPPVAQATVWKDYQDAVERFYDQLKINKELRDYDFRKNLSDKLCLIEEAEKLNDEADVITAFRRLQALHDKWREIGPVAKEVREEIWAKFKDASAAINKRYQAHFEARKAQEKANEDAKTAICERVEALDFSELKALSAWDKMTKTILEAQAEWKTLGYASKKANNALFARFRAVCDKFFTAKAEYFKNTRAELASNLEKKIALCERAEALKDSKEWRKTTDELVALQKEWKTIGTVAKKHSDSVWRRFVDACDYFFEEKKKATSGTRRTEQANLKAKQDLIAELKAIPADTPREEVLQAIRDSRTRWQEIGHVPFREKDKLYDSFRAAINELYEKHDIRETRARFAAFESRVSEMDGDGNKLNRERERLVRAVEQRRQELQTYQNNLGFFNSKSKAGDSMVREMERRLERIKEEIAELEKKIEVIDNAI